MKFDLIIFIMITISTEDNIVLFAELQFAIILLFVDDMVALIDGVVLQCNLFTKSNEKIHIEYIKLDSNGAQNCIHNISSSHTRIHIWAYIHLI